MFFFQQATFSVLALLENHAFAIQQIYRFESLILVFFLAGNQLFRLGEVYLEEWLPCSAAAPSPVQALLWELGPARAFMWHWSFDSGGPLQAFIGEAQLGARSSRVSEGLLGTGR